MNLVNLLLMQVLGPEDGQGDIDKQNVFSLCGNLQIHFHPWDAVLKPNQTSDIQLLPSSKTQLCNFCPSDLVDVNVCCVAFVDDVFPL